MSSFRFFANATNMEIKVEIKGISILNHHGIYITFLRKTWNILEYETSFIENMR